MLAHGELLLGQSAESIAAKSNIEVHAHRGGAQLYPENSMLAFRSSISKIGSTAIELDIHQTSDLKLVIQHDFQINPEICLDPQGKKIETNYSISDMTYDEVRAFDCGTLVGLPRGTPMPSLDEVFTNIEKLKTPSGALPYYDLHIKWDPTTISASDYVNLILTTVNQYNVLARVHILNDTRDILSAAKAAEPTLELYYLMNAALGPSDYQLISDLQVTTVAPVGSLLDASMVEALHNQGVKVIPWTVDDPYQWASLITIGVDGIITDNPFRLKQFIKKELNITSENNGTQQSDNHD